VTDYTPGSASREARAREKRMASMMLLFPEPFGPEMTVKCSKKGMVVFGRRT
jgi:hypothetical protein